MDVRDLPPDVIDHPTLEQILEMDDDEDERDFSKGIVVDFLSQAETTLEEIEEALYVRREKPPQTTHAGALSLLRQHTCTAQQPCGVL